MSKKQTLLEKAKEVKLSRIKGLKEISDEHIDLALAWLKDEIRATQFGVAMGYKLELGNYQRHLSIILKEAYKKGRIKLSN